jgi:hypothetical protein
MLVKDIIILTITDVGQMLVKDMGSSLCQPAKTVALQFIRIQ